MDVSYGWIFWSAVLLISSSQGNKAKLGWFLLQVLGEPVLINKWERFVVNLFIATLYIGSTFMML